MFTTIEMTKLSLGNSPDWAKDKIVLQDRLDLQGAWYDNFFFDNDASTKGRSPSSKKLQALGLPLQLQDVKIIDVGAYEGFYSFHMEQRGADVTANDHFVWNWPGDNSRTNFDLIYEVTGSKIAILDAEITSLPVKKNQITLFLGVLYHLEDQIDALKKIRESATELVVLETLVDALDANGPTIKYYPGSTLNNDQSNQFGPNLDALVGLIDAAGYRSFEFKGIWEINPVQSHADKFVTLSPLKSARVVFWLYP